MIQPLGPLVDAKAARKPQPVKIEGRYGSVERLTASKHAAVLWDFLKDHDEVWTYLSAGPFSERAEFERHIELLALREDPYAYAVLDRTGVCVGIATLMEIRPAMRVIEVGNILYSPALQRTPLASEIQFLLARYVFEGLGYRRYEWKCNALNEPSRRAALRLGFTFEGIFRQHMIVKDRNRDTAWFSMLDSEWPMRKAAFEAWLAPENFDAQGRQRRKLETIRS